MFSRRGKGGLRWRELGIEESLWKMMNKIVLKIIGIKCRLKRNRMIGVRGIE